MEPWGSLVVVLVSVVPRRYKKDRISSAQWTMMVTFFTATAWLMPRYKLSGWHLGDKCTAVTFSAHVMSQGVKIVEERWEMEIPRGGVADLGDLGKLESFQ